MLNSVNIFLPCMVYVGQKLSLLMLLVVSICVGGLISFFLNVLRSINGEGDKKQIDISFMIFVVFFIIYLTLIWII